MMEARHTTIPAQKNVGRSISGLLSEAGEGKTKNEVAHNDDSKTKIEMDGGTRSNLCSESI